MARPYTETVADRTRTPDDGSGTISAKQTTGILAASLTSAASSLLITIIAARALPASAQFAEFLVFWALYFGVIGVIAGTQGEATRAVSAASVLPAEDRAKGSRVIWAAAVLGVAAAAILLLSSPLWFPRFLEISSFSVVLVISAGVLLSAGHFTMVGSLSGLRHWGSYAWLFGADGAVRLMLVLGAGWLFAGQLLPIQIATAAPAGAWVVMMLISAKARQAYRARADVRLAQLVRQTLMAMASSASWAALVTGYPALLRLTAGQVEPRLLAGTILAITLTRAPIMIPLQALQGVAINKYTIDEGRHLGILLKPMAGVGLIGILGAGLAALLGPWIVATLYGDEYQVSALALALFTLIAVLMAWLVLTGAGTLAISAHSWFTAGWFTAALATFAISALPIPLPYRAIVALAAGPFIGVLIHLAKLIHHARSGHTTPTDQTGAEHDQGSADEDAGQDA